MRRTSLLVSVLVLAVILAVGARYAYRWVHAFDGKREAAISHLETATKQLEDGAQMHREAAESLNMVAAETAKRAAKRRASYTPLTPVAEAPDTCVHLLIERDNRIADVTQEAADWKTAFHEQKEAYARLQSADTLQQAATDTAKKAVTVAKQGPSLLSKLLPRPSVAGFVGVCTTGKLCAGGGLTLGYNF